MDKKKAAVPLVCHGHSRPVVDLFYSPVTSDGFFLISASKDSCPMLRNGETGDWIGTFEGHKGAVWSCCLDTNALRAASASADFTAKLWDALTGDELDSFEHKHIVRACAFSEDTHLLLTGGVEKILRILDLNRPDVPPREVDSSPGSIRTVAWLHSDQTILSSCTDMGGVRYECCAQHFHIDAIRVTMVQFTVCDSRLEVNPTLQDLKMGLQDMADRSRKPRRECANWKAEGISS
ncbi:uncharacterized protein LOC110643944 [Hevea brasiliensis]|uniref:uncharacterized protein LOC110643944 n=1 Tax=Hevea brasiliensis TaxID=3981 RepID=UPI0025F4A4A9|nr:uncharacterized protein LOC110643944 [Hevea brasiliensis]